MRRLFLVITVVSYLALGSYTQSKILTEYKLYTVPGESAMMHVLRILPDGEFVNPDEHYALIGQGASVRQTHDKKMLLACSGLGTKVYRINPDETLTYLSGNNAAWANNNDAMKITPNNELVLFNTPGLDNIFRLTTMGELINTGNLYNGALFSAINPHDNPVITKISPISAAVYWLDYTTGSMAQVTTFSTGANGLSFTPDGSLGLLWGIEPSPTSSGQVVVLTIDTSGTVDTTSQAFLPFGEIGNIMDLRITPNGKYAFVASDAGTAGGCIVATLVIDTVTGRVTNTGIRSSKPTLTSLDILEIRISDDGRLLVAYYWDDAYWSKCLATAFINWDGTLTWTGYTFPYDDTFCSGLDFMEDMEIVSFYATAVPEELWRDLE